MSPCISAYPPLSKRPETNAGGPECQARRVGRAKYAIVVSGERDEVVGWGYDEESVIKIAQALNKADKL